MSDSVSILLAILIVTVAIIGGPILIMRMAEFSHDRSYKTDVSPKNKRRKNDRT